MWKTLAKSVQGVGHRRGDIPCQDSCRIHQLSIGEEQVLILTASDGAGSAEQSEIGSRTACESMERIVVDELMRWGGLKPFGIAQAYTWYQQVLHDLQANAELLGVPVRQLACTLLTAVVGETGAAFCQIGDGAIATKVDGKFEHVFWPQSGEYANTTNFITGGRLENDLMFEWRDAQINEITIFTDGLQPVALNYAQRHVHQPFFSPLFNALANQPNPSELEQPMLAFLESKSLAERTDDDLTLILAMRNVPHNAIL